MKHKGQQQTKKDKREKGNDDTETSERDKKPLAISNQLLYRDMVCNI